MLIKSLTGEVDFVITLFARFVYSLPFLFILAFLARKILHSAAAKGECVVVQPDLGTENGNEPERLKKFWLGLDKGMKYSSQFNTIYTSIFDLQ